MLLAFFSSFALGMITLDLKGEKSLHWRIHGSVGVIGIDADRSSTSVSGENSFESYSDKLQFYGREKGQAVYLPFDLKNIHSEQMSKQWGTSMN